MGKSKTGLIAGTILGAIGITYAMSDKRMRSKIMRESHKMMNKATDIADKMDII